MTGHDWAVYGALVLAFLAIAAIHDITQNRK
jgi:hypothetical protein